VGTEADKNWADGWLGKLREDQQNAKADMALIISQTLPKNVESFDLIDRVWVARDAQFPCPSRRAMRS